MNISTSFKLSAGEVEGLSSSYFRLERMRIKFGPITIGVFVVIGLLLQLRPVIVVTLLGLLVISALSLTWLKTAKRAVAYARTYVGPVETQL